MNILLIEDNEGDVFLFEDLLVDIGYKAESITVLKDGEQAFEYLSDYQNLDLDLVFLDINLPKLNGHDVLERLHENLYKRNIPVVILSSSSNVRDMKLIELPCVVKYILKPIEPQQLIYTLNQFVKS